jgi:hypothetical protein
MRVRPDSLFARLVLTLVLGMALTMVVTLWVQFPERETFVFRVSALRAAYRLADMLKLMDQLPSGSREKLAAIAAARRVETTVGVPPPGTVSLEPSSNAAVFHDVLVEDLGRNWPIVVEVSPARVAPETGNAPPADGFEFNGQAQLSDGTWVSFRLQEPRRLAMWPRHLITNMLINPSEPAIASTSQKLVVP